MDAYGLRGNVSVHLLSDIPGGGSKRIRGDESSTILITPSVRDDDHEIVRDAMTIKEFSLSTRILALQLPALQQMCKV
jgi:hypothetical protein